MKMKFFASCPRGLEELLYKEAEHYNFERVELNRGGLYFTGTAIQALDFALETRIASRVYKEIGSFDFNSERDMYKAAKEIPWTKILNPSDTIKITSIISRDSLRSFKNSHFLSLVLKDAIVDDFKEKAGKRPSIELINPDYPLLLRIEPSTSEKRHKGIVAVDIIGYPLHKRGYRNAGHEAPIKENLAAALISQINWDRELPLYDPFCGSGTFLIEAALLKHNIAPTFLHLELRDQSDFQFSCERQKWFQRDEELKKSFENLCQELISRSKNGRQNFGVAEFHGNDQSNKAIEMLIQSWSRLGLPRKALRFSNENAINYLPDESLKNGFIITNPPYGLRLEEKDEKLEKLYYDFGESLKNNWKGFTAYLVSQDAAMRKKISLRTHMRFEFFNGPLECRLLGYELF